MTLITGATAVSIADHIFAYSPRIDFSAYASGAEAVALNFTSPNDFFVCTVTNSIDSGSWAANDIIAVIYRGNGETIYQSKWGVNATTLGQNQATDPIRIVLPPNTVFKAVLSLQSATAMVGSGSVVLVGKKIGGPLA